jgi:hypothetical protein
MKRVREFDRVEERLAALINPLQQEGIHASLSPILKCPEQAGQGSPLFLDMGEEGKILFNSEGFFCRGPATFK